MPFCEPKRPRYPFWQVVNGQFTPEDPPAPARIQTGIKEDTPEAPEASKRPYLITKRRVTDAEEIIRGEVMEGDYLALIDGRPMHFRKEDFEAQFNVLPDPPAAESAS